MAKEKPKGYQRKTEQNFAADDLKKVMSKVFGYGVNDAPTK